MNTSHISKINHRLTLPLSLMPRNLNIVRKNVVALVQLRFAFTMKQTYFQKLKYSKNYLIPNPQNLYEQYVNAFAFSEMVKSQNLVPNKKELQLQAQNSWREYTCSRNYFS